MGDAIAILYEPGAGEHIATACREAVGIANRRGLPVQFVFNGVELTARPGDEPEALAIRYSFPAGRRAGIVLHHDRRNHQRRIDALIARLPGVVKELGPLVRWCVEFGDAADHVGVEWDRAAVIAAVEAAGWREDAHVGRAESEFEGHPEMIGEYLVGQALNAMRLGLPPHPGLTEKFAREAGFLPEKS